MSKKVKKQTDEEKKCLADGKVHKYSLTKEGNVAVYMQGLMRAGMQQKGGKVWKVGVSGLKRHVSQFMITGR